MKVIAVASGKGGVGKTTLCANLSVALKRQGHTVVSVDMDPQNGLGLHFGLPANHLNGISRATLSSGDWRAAMWHSEQGDMVLPYGLINDLDRVIFESKLADNNEYLLAQLNLLNLPEDSYVLLDTPPGASIYQQQAFSACHVVVLTLLPDAASFATANKYIKKIEMECYSRPDFIGHIGIVNQVDRSRLLNSDMTDLMREELNLKYFSVIHQDQSVAEALACGQVVLDYDAECSGTRDISDAVKTLKELMAVARVVH
jgi:cellulose synthase operon protein YhjQ